MAEENQARFWVPTRTYDFEVKIGKEDYSPDLYAINLITSIESPYQVFQLDLFLDPHDIITQQIYGQTPIKLTVRFLGPANVGNVELERIQFDLMPIDTKFTIPQYEIINTEEVNVGQMKDRRIFRITTVPRKPYSLMNQIVNGTYYGSRVSAIIREIFDENFPGSTIRYDTIGKNSEVLQQVLVPPTTFYEAIRYLNRTFGLFDGICAVHCDYNNVLHIMNLTSRIKLAHALTLWHLASNVDSKDVLESEEKDNTIYYTYQEIVTGYSGNAAFSAMGPTNRFIISPRDTLTATISLDLETFASQYGLISKGKSFYYDKEAISSVDRITYHKDHTGYDLTQSFINANLGKRLSEMATLTADISKYMYIEPLLKVGHSVQVHSKVTEMKELVGKYILKASEVAFLRTQDWNSGARLYLIRTNRTD